MFWEGININVKASNMPLTDALVDYVVRRVTNLGKVLKKIRDAGGDVLVEFQVEKTTNHHKQGLVYRAECNITISGRQHYGEYTDENLYAAIDGVKDIMLRDLNKFRDKKQTLYKRGAKILKEAVRGGFTTLKKIRFWKRK
jgi:ribosomal subunit interface protein